MRVPKNGTRIINKAFPHLIRTKANVSKEFIRLYKYAYHCINYNTDMIKNHLECDKR
jgi:hypothetical protein